MVQKERLDTIVELIKKNGFVTVKFLTEELHYSTATINRDLNVLENSKTIRRIYGGAELTEQKQVALYFRNHKMRPVKNKIARTASECINDNDVIFIDCSTTAQHLGKYITNKKNLTVITNNITLASFLSEYDITVIILGGKIMEPPSMVYSRETVENAHKYGADKLFFSAGGVTPDGKISASEYDAHNLLINAMMENASETYLLIDHEKLTEKSNNYICDLQKINTVICDFDFSEETKKKYSDTVFVKT